MENARNMLIINAATLKSEVNAKNAIAAICVALFTVERAHANFFGIYSLFAKKEMRNTSKMINIICLLDLFWICSPFWISYLLFLPDAWLFDRNLAQVPRRVAQVAAAEPRVFTGVTLVQ